MTVKASAVLDSDEAMVAMAIEEVLDHSLTDFDIYLRVGGHLIVYAPAPYHWTRHELSRLLADGHRELWVHNRDQSRIEAYRQLGALPDIDENLEPSRRVVQITDAASEFTRVLFDHGLTPAALDKGRSIASSLIQCIEEDSTCVRELGKLASHDNYTYYHSARVSAYSLAIAMQLSLKDNELLKDLGLGCLLHDVGKNKIDLNILNKKGALTEAEWAVMKRHPEYGHEQMNHSETSLVPREIILHHHERFDGTGYPHGLREHEILEEVKIASFADVFDALTSNRPYHLSRTRFEALDFIKFKLLNNLHKDSFRAMVEILKEEASLR